jgi:hypothetical protein
MRVRPLRPLPNAVGWLTKRGDAPPPGTSPHPAQNPPHALRRLRRQGPAAPCRRKTPRASASPHSSSGRRATGYAAPTWPAPGRASPAGTADRDRRQLRSHPARPADQGRPAHRRLHLRTGQHRAVTPAPAQAMSTHTRGSPAGPARLAARATAGPPSPARQQAKPGGSLDGSEVPRGFRTVHPIGWMSGKVN